MSDLDLAIDLAPAAAATTVEALTELGLQPRLPVDAREFADPAMREGWIRDPGTWQGHRTQQRRARLAATPAQRLARLKDAIAVAHQSGALPRRRADASC